jgi:Uma2 family endonuclease
MRQTKRMTTAPDLPARWSRRSKTSNLRAEDGMSTTARTDDSTWTAEEFLRTDQHEFGDAWRYELVDGQIIAHAAPSPDHAAILSGLTAALANRLRGSQDGCRPEAGSRAAPRTQQRATARIPDATVRCGDLPRVVFDVVSPSELRAWRAGNQRRRHLQDVAGVQEIVEIYQDEASVHVYRHEDGGQWSFDAIDGLDAVLHLRSVGLDIPLSEIYEFVSLT